MERGRKKIFYAPNKFEAYGEEEIAAVNECLRAGWLAPGPLTERFEGLVAGRFQKAHGVMVNSGSSANLLAVLGAGLGKGDEVVTAACTFSTTVAPLEQAGCRIVFCDVTATRFVPTVEQVMAGVTENTRCILLADLIGSPVDWAVLRAAVDALPPRAHGQKVILIQDCADTIRPAPHSDLVTTSFYASHVITAGGGGGMVMFDDARRFKGPILTLRDWGRVGNNSEDMDERFKSEVDGIPYDFKFLYSHVGYNMKSTEMNAAFGVVQVDRLDGFLAKRRSLVQRYLEKLKDHTDFYTLPEDRPDANWLAFPLLCRDRMKVLRHLEGNDVQVRVLMAGNITRHPAYRQHLKPFPDADRIMAEGFLVGAHHGMTPEDVDTVCDLLIQAKSL